MVAFIVYRSFYPENRVSVAYYRTDFWLGEIQRNFTSETYFSPIYLNRPEPSP